jgi:hypothetical protein
MSPATKSYRKLLTTRLAGCLVILLLSSSVLTASHVHDFESGIGQGHFEHCAAYHLADHQQSASAENPIYETALGESLYYSVAQSVSTRQAYLPHSRAPPSVS